MVFKLTQVFSYFLFFIFFLYFLFLEKNMLTDVWKKNNKKVNKFEKSFGNAFFFLLTWCLFFLSYFLLLIRFFRVKDNQELNIEM